jgi:hypothetical protein
MPSPNFHSLAQALPESGEDLFSTLSLAMNVAQTCFLAWLAVYARRRD